MALINGLPLILAGVFWLAPPDTRAAPSSDGKAAAGESSACAHLLNDASQALVSLSELGLKEGAFTSRDLLRAFSKTPIANPVSLRKDYKNINLWTAFQQQLALVQGGEVERVRQKIAELTKGAQQNEERSRDASERTRDFANPQLLSMQPLGTKAKYLIRLFWQPNGGEGPRAVGIDKSEIRIWYPDAPEKSTRTQHNIDMDQNTHPFDLGRYPFLSALAARDGDVLIAHRRPPPENFLRSLARRFGFSALERPAGKTPNEHYGIFSFNQNRVIAQIEVPPGLINKVHLTQLDNGDVYLVILTYTSIQVFHKNGNAFTKAHEIPGDFGPGTQLFTDVLAGGEVLVLSTAKVAASEKERTVLRAYNPIRGEDPLVEWDLGTAVERFSPFVLRSGELVVAVTAADETNTTYQLMNYVRQSQPGKAKISGPRSGAYGTLWHEREDGTVLALHSESDGNGSVRLSLYEPFASIGPAFLHTFQMATTGSHVEVTGPRLLPKVLRLSDGREVLLFHQRNRVEAHDLHDFSLFAAVTALPAPDYVAAALPESGEFMILANGPDRSNRKVLLQELTASKPTLTHGHQPAAHFLPPITGKDGRPWIAFALEEAGDLAPQVVFYRLTSAMEAKPNDVR